MKRTETALWEEPPGALDIWSFTLETEGSALTPGNCNLLKSY